MGIAAILNTGQALSPLFRPLTDTTATDPTSATGATPIADAQGTPSAGNLGDSVQTGSDPFGLEARFNALVYSAQMQKVALSVSYGQAIAQAGNAGDGSAQQAQVQTQQLTFDFYAESRSQELAVFQQRAGAVADKLGGTQRQTYIEASRQVAARFSMSLTVTGAALGGFANAAEGATQAGGDASTQNAAINNLLDLSRDALAKSNEVLNKIFELLGDFFNSTGDLGDRFTAFVAGLKKLGVIDFSDGQKQLPQQAQGQSGGPQSVQIKAGQVSFQMEFSFQYSETTIVQQGEVQQSDPITLDLNGNGIELSSYKDGFRFDITGAGRDANTAFVSGGDAFLAIDRNGNGKIDSGKELFGDQNGAKNGFEELRKLDSNGDGIINKQDTDFGRLVLLFGDKKGQGKPETQKLMTLGQAGVREVSLNYANVNEAAAGGNRTGQVATFVRNNGSRGRVADTILNYTV